jgi:PAS domain S-box-containing protein
MAEKPTYEELKKRVQELEKIESEFEVLKADKQRLEMILSSVDTGLSLINPDYTISWVNDTIRSIFPNGDPVGKTCHRFFESSEHMCDPCPTFEAYKSGQIQKMDKYNPSKNKWYSIISQPVKDEAGQIVSVLEGITEITEKKNYEQQILKEKNLLQQVMETSPVGITMVDEKGNISMANARAEEILGLKRSDIYKRRYNDQEWQIKDVQGNAYPDDQLPFELVKKSGKSVFGIKHSLVWPDGKKVLLSINATPLLDRSGNFNGMVSALVDITERKQAEESLQESESRFRSIYENTAVGLAQVSLDFKIISANEAYCIMLGYQDKDLVGRHLKEITHPDVIEENIQKQANLASGKIDHYRMEKKFIHKNGKTVHAILDANLIRDPSGKAIYFLGSVVDITERKRAEMDLQSQKKLLKGVLDSIKDTIGVQLPDHTMVQYNRAGYELLGLTEDQVYGKKCYELLGRAAPCDLCATSRTIISRRMETLENFIPELDRHFLCTSNPVLDENGNIKLIIEQLTDITEKKKMDAMLQQAQKLESIGSLAGGIAHDFNNLLFPIVGLSEIMLNDFPPGSPKHHDIQQIYKAGNRGRELVQQILSFSRQSERHLIPVHIQKILKEVYKLCRATIPADIPITRDIQTDCRPVLADPTQIHQIAMNLITNAYHSVEPTGGSISIQLKEITYSQDDNPADHLESGAYVMLSVSDTGTGIDPVIKDKIFDPYFTTKEKGRGTGLGLATVYGIVKAHGGDIRVYSEVGEGACFHVYLPVLEKTETIDTHEQRQTIPKGTEHILLVDDEPSIVHLEKQMLERLGYRITSFTGSKDALAAFETDPSQFDLVLTDMNMPHLNGMQLAKKLIAARPDIPIIICTGFSERTNITKIEASGIRGLLMKPVGMMDLAHKVREVLDEMKE